VFEERSLQRVLVPSSTKSGVRKDERVKRLVHSAAFWLGVTYLALIPAFAFGFDSLGHHSFHDANAEREKGAYDDAAGLRTSLSRALVSHLGDLGWRPTFSHLRVRLHPSELNVTGIELTTAGRLLLEVSGTYGPPGPSPLLEGVFHFWVEPGLREPASAILRPGQPTARLVPVAFSLAAGSANENPKHGRFDPPVSLVFPGPGGTHGSQTAGTFGMSEATYQRLEDFFLAVDGDPSFASDHLSRMLYLSAVTITTLGFGDITPVSEEARFLVAAEAVLGIVVIGAFLSLLALGRHRGRAAGSN
jgi:hypothetical protein